MLVVVEEVILVVVCTVGLDFVTCVVWAAVVVVTFWVVLGDVWGVGFGFADVT